MKHFDYEIGEAFSYLENPVTPELFLLCRKLHIKRNTLVRCFKQKTLKFTRSKTSKIEWSQDLTLNRRIVAQCYCNMLALELSQFLTKKLKLDINIHCKLYKVVDSYDGIGFQFVPLFLFDQTATYAIKKRVKYYKSTLDYKIVADEFLKREISVKLLLNLINFDKAIVL